MNTGINVWFAGSIEFWISTDGTVLNVHFYVGDMFSSCHRFDDLSIIGLPYYHHTMSKCNYQVQILVDAFDVDIELFCISIGLLL